MKKYLMLFFVLLMMYTFTGSLKKDTLPDNTPCNPDANESAKKVLKYIAWLSTDDFDGVIAGQNCYHGNQICSNDYLEGFNKLVANLYKETGKWVGIIGIDYEHDKLFSPEELSEANKVLIDYWDKGGLITINWAPRNPWLNDELDLVKSNKNSTWNGPASTRDHTNVNMKDLINPKTGIYKEWRRKLDRIARALAELRDAGAVVLWRPLQEMNGNWFWWGMKSHPFNPSPYINLYRDMFNYFTYDKGLNNLLWVYSPNFGGSMSDTWNRPVDWAYPGDDFVDIIAGTSYNDQLKITDYEKYISFGKPVGMGEYGPDLSGPLVKKGTFDTTKYVKVIKEKYPRVAYWVSWHSFPGECWSIITNKNYRQLLNDPDVITIDKMNWK